MSQMAPEPPARPQHRENVFTRRIGPLPMWIWLLIVAAIVVGWAWWRNRKQAGATSTQTATGTDASQVPQFVNQTYTTVQPPAQPVTVTQKVEESEESEDETETGKRHRKKPVNRRHPTHHRPKRKPEPELRERRLPRPPLIGPPARAA